MILVRHADRDTSQGNTQDNSLSAKGRKQADTLACEISEYFTGSAAVSLYSSPKRRCLETLQPLAKIRNAQITVDPRLDEQGRNEALITFENRVHDFVTDLRQVTNGLTVVCSHGDWIPIFLRMINEEVRDLRKGEWIEIKSIGAKFSR